MLTDGINEDNSINQKMEVIMDDRLVKIRATMFKNRIKSYQISKELNIPDCSLSRMLNGHIEMAEDVYQGIINYLNQYEG